MITNFKLTNEFYNLVHRKIYYLDNKQGIYKRLSEADGKRHLRYKDAWVEELSWLDYAVDDYIKEKKDRFREEVLFETAFSDLLDMPGFRIKEPHSFNGDKTTCILGRKNDNEEERKLAEKVLIEFTGLIYRVEATEIIDSYIDIVDELNIENYGFEKEAYLEVCPDLFKLLNIHYEALNYIIDKYELEDDVFKGDNFGSRCRYKDFMGSLHLTYPSYKENPEGFLKLSYQTYKHLEIALKHLEIKEMTMNISSHVDREKFIFPMIQNKLKETCSYE